MVTISECNSQGKGLPGVFPTVRAPLPSRLQRESGQRGTRVPAPLVKSRSRRFPSRRREPAPPEAEGLPPILPLLPGSGRGSSEGPAPGRGLAMRDWLFPNGTHSGTQRPDLQPQTRPGERGAQVLPEVCQHLGLRAPFHC